MSRLAHRFRCAFSLVELLVVCGVVALLSALLIPSLGAARAQAHLAKCASNLRQLGHALQYYASDNKGLAMPAAYVAQATPLYWWGAETGGGVDRTRGFTARYLDAELRDGGLFECPRQPWGSYVPQGTSGAVTSTYGYNGYFLSPAHTPGWSAQIQHRPWQNFDRMRESARVFVFADSAILLGATLKNAVLLDPPWLYSNGRWSQNFSPTTSFRHGGATVAVFADGHADARGPGDGRFSSLEHAIGSVGANNDPRYVPDWRDW